MQRPRPLPLLLLAAFAAAPVIAAAQTGGAACRAPAAADIAAAVAATNATRAASGLAPVRGSTVLSAAAAKHACDMARRGSLSHRGSASGGPSQRLRAEGYRAAITAENIAAGPFDIAGAFAAWNASRAHKANMVIPQVREVGVGQAVGADGRTRFWAAIFAAPR